MSKIISISTPEDFNFSECLRFLHRSKLECVFQPGAEDVKLVLKIEGELFLIRVFFKNKKLQVEILEGTPNSQQKNYILEFVKDWLDVSADLTDFYAISKKDKMLKSPTKKYKGLRLIGIPSLVEAISWAIIGQQINLTFAYTLKKRLVENFGETIVFDEKKYFVFPEPETLAQLKVEDLRPLQFSRSKASYLIGVARAISEGQLSKPILKQYNYETAKEHLIQLKGVGNWTADYVLMKCLRHPDAFPIADVGLHNAIKFQLGMDQKPTVEAIEKMSAGWDGWKSYATFYLWHSLLEA